MFDARPRLKINIKYIFVGDSHVAGHYLSMMVPGDPGGALRAMFRVKDCKIVEHCGVIQPMLAQPPSPDHKRILMQVNAEQVFRLS